MTYPPLKLVIMGPPGAGKGTQAKIIAERLSVPAISTGDIFRRNVSGGTELGLEARGYMDAGDYVPDALTNSMVRVRLAEPDALEGFLLDGYPRTLAQVEELDSMLAERDTALDAVVQLTVDTDELVERLARRARAEDRADDTTDVIRHRQELYAEQTAPLVEVYDGRRLLVRVDGIGAVPEVTSRVLGELEQIGAAAS